jgi:hypothetical protein
MKYILMVIALLFASLTAMADSNTAVSGSTSISGAYSGATQGNQQNINFNNPGAVDEHLHGTTTVRTAPTVYAPSFGTSSPCSLALSGGVSVVGFGGTFGKAYSDSECNRRETARVLFQLGHADAAAKVMCNDKEAAVALGPEICPVPEVNPQ